MRFITDDDLASRPAGSGRGATLRRALIIGAVLVGSFVLYGGVLLAG